MAARHYFKCDTVLKDDEAGKKCGRIIGWSCRKQAISRMFTHLKTRHTEEYQCINAYYPPGRSVPAPGLSPAPPLNPGCKHHLVREWKNLKIDKVSATLYENSIVVRLNRPSE